MFRLNHTVRSNASCRWLRRQLHQQSQSSVHLRGIIISDYPPSIAGSDGSAPCCYYSSSSSFYLSQKNNNDDKDHQPDVKKIHAEWIPPNRPLHGDQDHSQLFKTQKDLDRTEDALFTIENENESEEVTLKRLEEALALEEKLEAERQKEFAQQKDEFREIDWLATRRQALGTPNNPEQSEVPIRHHELLTEDELTTLLEILGGHDILVLPDDNEYPRMGGANGMILCTASSSFLVTSIAKNLVHHLKERHLQDLGVAGAKMGKHFLQTMASSSRDSSSHWNVIDCRNYIVHIFDAKTRNALNLEELWSGKDPLWKLNINDEDSMDDYVAEHHVPFAYGPNTEGLYGDAAATSKLQRQQWLTAPHRPVIPTEQKRMDRRAEKRRRRERKRQEAKEAYW